MSWIVIAQFIQAWIEQCQETDKKLEAKLADPVLRPRLVKAAIRGGMRNAGLRGKERRQEAREWVRMSEGMRPDQLLPAVRKMASSA